MAVVISSTAQQAMLNALAGQIDGGSGDANGDFECLNSSFVTLGTVQFQNPSFASATGSGPVSIVQNGTTITTLTAPSSGTIAYGRFRNRANTVVVTFTVAVGGGDLSVGTVNIPLGASSIDVSGLTLTMTVI